MYENFRVCEVNLSKPSNRAIHLKTKITLLSIIICVSAMMVEIDSRNEKHLWELSFLIYRWRETRCGPGSNTILGRWLVKCFSAYKKPGYM